MSPWHTKTERNTKTVKSHLTNNKQRQIIFFKIKFGNRVTPLPHIESEDKGGSPRGQQKLSNSTSKEIETRKSFILKEVS